MLLLHEFDHVAISTDPRLLKLIQVLEWSQHLWSVDWEGNEDPTPSQVSEMVAERLSERRKAIEDLVNRYYRQLDQLSNNGLTNISDRRAFFLKLYTIESLREERFLFWKT